MNQSSKATADHQSDAKKGFIDPYVALEALKRAVKKAHAENAEFEAKAKQSA